MVRVYDMVTYEVCEPEQEAFTLTSTARSVAAPMTGLQLVEATPTAAHQELHPAALYSTDVDEFLALHSD